MRTILIVFAILLLLLTLLGAFGGSIKYSEPFYEVARKSQLEEQYEDARQFEEEQYEDMPPPAGPAEHYASVSGTGGAPNSNKPKSEFYMPPPTNTATSGPVLPTTPSPVPQKFANGPAEGDYVQEGFYIEPFEDIHNSGPAEY
jgi:hypothetical protein